MKSIYDIKSINSILTMNYSYNIRLELQLLIGRHKTFLDHNRTLWNLNFLREVLENSIF